MLVHTLVTHLKEGGTPSTTNIFDDREGILDNGEMHHIYRWLPVWVYPLFGKV